VGGASSPACSTAFWFLGRSSWSEPDCMTSLKCAKISSSRSTHSMKLCTSALHCVATCCTTSRTLHRRGCTRVRCSGRGLRLHTCTLQRTRPLCAQREWHADAANAACRGARCEVAGVSPVSAQMWQGCAQSRRRCGRGAHGAKCSPYTATHLQSVKTWATLRHEAKPVPQGTTGYYRVLQGTTGYYRVLQRTRSRF
jgi:hypothetical protein